jgi:hypothetical protein
MKPIISKRIWLLAVFLALAVPGTAPGYPPAPHHLFFGLVRDEMGAPINFSDADVILSTIAGTQFRTKIVPNLAPGINYRLPIPMDAGLTADDYRPNALRPSVPFRMQVKLGSTVYLPIEMTGSYSNLGEPAKSTRVNLTLGIDSDGDGLPDAWEYALIAALGGNLTLADINPLDDADGDGLSNIDEYLAGTYAFDPEDGFRLDIIQVIDDLPAVEFLAIRGRSYSLQASTDLETWVPVLFRIISQEPHAPWIQTVYPADVRVLRVELAPPEGEGPFFFKAVVH